MKTPITYYGGKQNMIKHILPLIPPHKTYVEAFAGGAALFFAKQKSNIEVLNDINGNVSNFYLMMKHHPRGLEKMINDTLHDEYTYNYCREIYRGRIPTDDLNKAWAFWVGCNMSFGASCFDGSFQITSNSQDNCHPGVRTYNKKKVFEKCIGRLEKTMVLNKDAIEVIKKYDNEDCFIYCDPPYFNARQGHYEGYKKDDFINLLEIASNSKSKIMISCYYDEVIEKFNFKKIQFSMNLGVKNGSKKIETILLNWKTYNDLFTQY